MPCRRDFGLAQFLPLARALARVDDPASVDFIPNTATIMSSPTPTMQCYAIADSQDSTSSTNDDDALSTFNPTATGSAAQVGTMMMGMVDRYSM